MQCRGGRMARPSGSRRAVTTAALAVRVSWSPSRQPSAHVTVRSATLDLVAVAAAVLVLDDVPGFGEIGDDAVGGALGDARPGRDVSQRAPGSWAMHSSTRAWPVRKLQSATPVNYHRLFPEIYC
jgi:hypothetical protein